MKNLTQSLLLNIITFVVLFTSLIQAGTTGKIVGQVVDASSGEPLIGVNIIFENEPLGAATDLDGSYLILNIPPGTYDLRAIMLGYNEMVVKNVKINVDKTTRVDFNLEETVLELGDVVEVIAERPLVKKDITSSESIVGSEEIENLPVESFTDVLNLQAGVTVDAAGDIHIRGGRTSEISYMVNGISINDAYSGDFAIEVENNSVQELSVISGTFNAEYGQAMSGVVNIVTKEGGDRFTGNANVYVGDYISANNNIFWDVDKFNPILNLQGNVSGPVPGIKRLNFFASGRYFENDGFIYGKNVFLPTDISNFSQDDPEDWVIMSHGETYNFNEELAQELIKEAESISMNKYLRYTGNLKLSYRISDLDRITLEGMYQAKEWREYDHRFRLNPTGDYQREKWAVNSAVFWNHVFNARTFLDIRASYFYTEFKQNVYDDIFDSRYVPSWHLQITGANAYLASGQQMWHFNRSTTTHLVKGDFTSQISKSHQIKAGGEFKRHRLSLHEFEVIPEIPERIAPLTSFNNNQYLYYPIEYAFYIQDKMEYQDLVVNVGVRFDHFNSDGQVPLDFENLNTTKTREAETNFQLSPRIGIAYSISEKGQIHVSYGHFFQTPNFFYLYNNPEFDLFPLQNTPSPPPQSELNTVGNAELKPQSTVIYEIGIQQQLGNQFSIAATAYYKDIRNLLGTEVLETIQGVKYGRYTNRDYAFVKGITFEFHKRHASGISANIDYTYQIAKGNVSDPNTAFLDAQEDPPNETEKQFVPLNWDRRHQLNATITIGKLGKYALSFIGRYGTGLPYTAEYQSVQTAVENSGRKPDQFSIDLFMYRNFSWLGLKYQFFVRIFNLLDNLNEMDVFRDTGRAGYTLEPLYVGGLHPRGLNSLDQYFIRPEYYSEPRRIHIGFELQF